MAYFANSTEGEILNRQCGECRIPDDAPCPVLMAQQIYNYVQVDNENLKLCLRELVDIKGNCKMKPLIDGLSGRRSSDRG